MAFSKRVHYYGKVMDVMVQQHPEYASLAWGAMKIVFGVGQSLQSMRNEADDLAVHC